MIAISFKNLRKVFVKSGKQFDALCDVSFDVKEGEFFGLLGPNGAGKTSLINILGGISNPTFGTVEVFGLDVTEVPERTKRLLGIVPQELVFDPFFTVKETLKIQSGLFGIRDNNLWIEECLVELGLTEQANANMRALSGGMKRRVLIAQALVHKPPIIVLDEPTAGVDVELRNNLWNNVKQLNKEGVTIILTTHYLLEAQEMCDRIAIIDKGNLVALDTTKKLLERIQTKKINFKVESVDLDKTLFMKGIKFKIISKNLITASYEKSSLNFGEIVNYFNQNNIKIEDIATDDGDLEDVFVQLTKH